MAMIGELLGTVAQFVPPWLLGILGVVVAALMLPGFLTGLKVKRVKALMRQTVRADDTRRKALQDDALRIAQGNGEILVALVREADKLNQPRLRDEALRQLKRVDGYALQARKLALPDNPAERKRERHFGHPVEASAFIWRLLESGAVEGAAEKLDEALERFPDDPGLQELAEAIALRRAEGSESPTPVETP
jgi:hypothetical protein